MSPDSRPLLHQNDCPQCGGEFVAREHLENERACVDCGWQPQAERRLCPNGHECRPATGPSCMVGSGYFYCGECLSEPLYRAMSGTWARGMYWPQERTTER